MKGKTEAEKNIMKDIFCMICDQKAGSNENCPECFDGRELKPESSDTKEAANSHTLNRKIQ